MAADRRRPVDLDRHLHLLIGAPRPRENCRGVSVKRWFAYAISHSAARLDVAPKISIGRLSSDPLASFRDGILREREGTRVFLRADPRRPQQQTHGKDEFFHVGLLPQLIRKHEEYKSPIPANSSHPDTQDRIRE